MIIRKVDVRDILFSDNSETLFEAYAQEAENKIIKEKIQPNCEKYVLLYDTGLLHCIGAFDKDKMVGFITFIINDVLHYSKLSSVIESQFVLKEYRKSGAWNKMLKLVKDMSKENGAKNIFMTTTPNSKLDKVLQKKGYILTNNIYTESLS